jgi:hypothetical protein
MMVFPLIAATFGILLAVASPAAACGEEPFFPSSAAHLEPFSVPAQEIGAWLTASPYSSGIRFASTLHGRDLRLDVTDFPDRAPEAGSIRALMQLGRVAGKGFDRPLLVDGQEVLFAVNETDLRTVGCQFIWPSNNGADPLMLMRTLIQTIREETTGTPIQDGSEPGSVPTAIYAMMIVQDSLNPAWVASARPGSKKLEIPEDRQKEMVGTASPLVQADARQTGKRLVLSGL